MSHLHYLGFFSYQNCFSELFSINKTNAYKMVRIKCPCKRKCTVKAFDLNLNSAKKKISKDWIIKVLIYKKPKREELQHSSTWYKDNYFQNPEID